MKELGEVTFMKEWMKALDDTRILALTHLKNLVSFPRYGRLKKKCWYKQICNSKSWLLLTGHFGPVFIRPSQWSITAVLLNVSDSSFNPEYNRAVSLSISFLKIIKKHVQFVLASETLQS